MVPLRAVGWLLPARHLPFVATHNASPVPPSCWRGRGFCGGGGGGGGLTVDGFSRLRKVSGGAQVQQATPLYLKVNVACRTHSPLKASHNCLFAPTKHGRAECVSLFARTGLLRGGGFGVREAVGIQCKRKRTEARHTRNLEYPRLPRKVRKLL